MQTLRGEVFLHVFVTKSEVLGKLNTKRANMIKQLTRLYVNDPNVERIIYYKLTSQSNVWTAFQHKRTYIIKEDLPHVYRTFSKYWPH